MSRLVDLFTIDGRTLVGRPVTTYPVSVNVGFGVVSPIVTGFTPIITQVQTGWRVVYTKPQVWPPRPGRPTIRPIYSPVYTTVTTGYTPIYSPTIIGGVYTPLMFGGIY